MEGMMQDQAGLELRLRALERSARRQRILTAGALGLALAALVTARQPGPTVLAKTALPAPEIQARRFVLVGADGMALGALEAPAGGGPQLVLRDRSGATRASLILAPDGAPSLVLGDATGRARVRLAAGADEALVTVAGKDSSAVTLANGGVAPRLALADAKGNERLWVAIRLGSPAVQFLDTQGIARSGLTTFNDDAGLAIVSGTDKSSPGLVLYGKDRTIVWSAP
jgi:hypothetical protein